MKSFHESQDGSEFVRDWRVAGTMMERVDSVYIDALVTKDWQVEALFDCMPYEAVNESLPRAIIEACVEALSG